ADVLRVVDGNVLVDGRLAEGHEKAEHKDQHYEGHQPHAGRKGDRTVNAVDDVVGLGIGEHEGGQHRYAEGPVHHLARAVLVGKVAAIGAKDAGGHRVEGGQHAGGGDVEPVDADE